MKIYQIEISNQCNLTCSYCPHPQQSREKGFMAWETFEKSIDLLKRCGQRTAYLHNFGEPLLHPDVVEFVRYCDTHGVTASFFTNGVLLNVDILVELANAGLRSLCISEHTKGELRRVEQLIADGGIPISLADTFRPIRRDLHSWGGQVRQHEPVLVDVGMRSRQPCIFERQHAAVVLWDGRVNVCCIDVEGRDTRGMVDDYLLGPERYRFTPIDLCRGCSLMRGEEDLT